LNQQFGYQRADVFMASDHHGASTKAILYAFIANLGIALSKTAAAVYTGSGSMLAEAIHSSADSANQVLLFIGLRQSQRPADQEHPLGYGKASYFWSFVVAILLFSLGGIFSVYEGWHKLHHPEALQSVWIALLVLGASIFLEIFSLLGCLKAIAMIRGDRSLGRWLRTTRSAELVVVLAEDLAAIFGLVLALIFVSLSAYTGSTTFDAIGSMAIGVTLIVISLFISWRIKALIVGRSAEPELRRLIERLIAKEPGIVTLFNTITIQFGPKVMVAAKIKLAGDLSCTQAAQLINDLESRLKEQMPEIGWCFIEPDVSD
jgi:cation diffusion facilitator family transporter